MKIRRCQGWYICNLPRPLGPAHIVQCEIPAVDGVHCTVHLDQKPQVWMEEPTRIHVSPLALVDTVYGDTEIAGRMP
jgi:hypothetical protein